MPQLQILQHSANQRLKKWRIAEPQRRCESLNRLLFASFSPRAHPSHCSKLPRDASGTTRVLLISLFLRSGFGFLLLSLVFASIHEFVAHLVSLLSLEHACGFYLQLVE